MFPEVILSQVKYEVLLYFTFKILYFTAKHDSRNPENYWIRPIHNWENWFKNPKNVKNWVHESQLNQNLQTFNQLL